jgi:putative membrane protein
MKLPELKEKLKSKYIVRVVAGVLTIALVGTGIGATAVFAEKNSTAVTAEADSTTGSSKDADDIADKLMDSVSLKDNDADKDESVYLISDANGNVNKTIVVDHLKNKDKKDTLEDASNLSDIENVKGKEKFTQSGDKLTWQAGGKDIYYQGTATEEPPVTQKVTYYLDGKEISPEDLAGKSGKVKIRFDYTNTTSYTETVNGEKQTVSVPFAAVTGLVLGDGFENIEVTNGKAEVSDSSSVVLGYALPGLKDSLGIKDGDLDGDVNIPEYMEMTADVKNFSMPAAMTFVVNASDYVSTDGIDTSDLDDMINDLKDASTQLQDGSKTLAEGTDTLADGLSTLQSKLGTFASGVGTLKSGLKTYTDGVSTLSGGLNTLGNSTGALVSGADKLNSGAGQLASGSATLKDGLKSYTDGANGLAKGASDLDAGIGTLAEKSGTLVDGATKLDDGASQLSASASSINEGIKSLDTGLKTPLTDKEKAGYQAAAKDSVDKQFSNPDNEANYENTKAKASGVYYETMTSDDSVKQAVQLLKNDSDLMNMINATVGATVETAIKDSVPDLASKDTATIKKTYNNSPKLQQSVKEVLNLPQTIPDYDALVSAIVDQKLNDMATKVMEGVANNSKDKVGEAVADAAKTGAENAAQSAVITGIESAKSNVSSQINAKQENGYSLVTGADALSTGASSLANGTKSLVNSIPTLTGGIKQLVDGSNTLVANNAQLNSGASQLADGTNQIVSGVDQLTTGSKTLSEGAHTLADGMVQFNEEGINKILDAYNGDLKPFTNKLQAVIDAGEEYQTYSAIADGQTGSVKFIYKLASIDAKADSDK